MASLSVLWPRVVIQSADNLCSMYRFLGKESCQDSRNLYYRLSQVIRGISMTQSLLPEILSNYLFTKTI